MRHHATLAGLALALAVSAAPGAAQAPPAPVGAMGPQLQRDPVSLRRVVVADTLPSWEPRPGPSRTVVASAIGGGTIAGVWCFNSVSRRSSFARGDLTYVATIIGLVIGGGAGRLWDATHW